MKRRKKNSSLKKYNKLNKISSLIWVLAGLGIFGFGIYYMEIFEKIFGVVAAIYGLVSLSTSKSPAAIKKSEEGRLAFLGLLLIIYSLVNPLGNIAILFDIYKRDWVIRGGLDEKK